MARQNYVREAYAMDQRNLALRLAKEREIGLVIYSDNHFKFENINFYPSTGAIYIDEAPSKDENRGAESFIQLIERRFEGRGLRLIVSNPSRTA